MQHRQPGRDYTVASLPRCGDFAVREVLKQQSDALQCDQDQLSSLWALLLDLTAADGVQAADAPVLLPEGAAPAAFDFESPPSTALQPLEDPEADLQVCVLVHKLHCLFLPASLLWELLVAYRPLLIWMRI